MTYPRFSMQAIHRRQPVDNPVLSNILWRAYARGCVTVYRRIFTEETKMTLRHSLMAGWLGLALVGCGQDPYEAYLSCKQTIEQASELSETSACYYAGAPGTSATGVSGSFPEER